MKGHLMVAISYNFLEKWPKICDTFITIKTLMNACIKKVLEKFHLPEGNLSKK